VYEAIKTLEIGKKIDFYAEFEDKVLKNLTKLRGSSWKRTTPKHFKLFFVFFN
jgi:hypothetical protein